MSSKKIHTSLAIDAGVVELLDKEVQEERRSRSFIIEKLLRERYNLPWNQKAQNSHADKA